MFLEKILPIKAYRRNPIKSRKNLDGFSIWIEKSEESLLPYIICGIR